MRLEKYELEFNAAKTKFQFISKGPKGEILKGISFSKMKVKEHKSVYNLEFGDIDPQTGDIDDLIVTDNSDRDLVLATVAGAVFDFFKKHKKSKVYFRGSTPARTRLYRWAINKYYDDLILYFEIEGILKNEIELFKKNGNYSGFLIGKK